jgi:hypothetical protein
VVGVRVRILVGVRVEVRVRVWVRFSVGPPEPPLCLYNSRERFLT